MSEPIDQFYLTKNPDGKIGVVAVASLDSYLEDTAPPISIVVTTNLIDNTAVPGQDIVYTVVVTNNSASFLTGVSIQASSNVPGNFVDTKCVSMGLFIVCPIGSMGPGSGPTLTFKYAVDPQAAPGKYLTTFTAGTTGTSTSTTIDIIVASP